jgi:hypothetical protein
MALNQLPTRAPELMTEHLGSGRCTVGAIRPNPATAAITRSSRFWLPPVQLYSRSGLPMRKYVGSPSSQAATPWRPLTTQ